jgi:hypothetical protein
MLFQSGGRKMAMKRKTTKRGKKLTGAKKLGKVEPLLKFNMTQPQISSYQTGGGGGTPSS